VLIQDDGTPCIADFGQSAVRHNGATLSSMVPGGRGTCRWMAVELFQSEASEELNVTRSSDIWSFGMLALELLTGEIPFSKLSDGAVILGVRRGERPDPPNPETVKRGLDSWLWEYLMQCWDEIPSKRPSIDFLASELNKLARDWSPPSSTSQAVSRCQCIPSTWL
jgi:serine/threonine protein kinase